MLRSEQHAVADYELDARGDRAGVGVQDGKDQRLHIEGHAVDRDRLPEDSGVTVPAQGARCLRREDLGVEGVRIVVRTGGDVARHVDDIGRARSVSRRPAGRIRALQDMN